MEKINIGGQSRPIRFGFAAIMSIEKATGQSVGKFLKNLEDFSITSTVQIVHAGLQDGARKAKMPFDVSLEEVADWIDEDLTVIEKCMTVFQESMVQSSEQGNAKATKS